MQLNIKTKFDIGQTVYFVAQSTSYEDIPCTHCKGNYREIVNGIEYTCPHCTGGRERNRVDDYEVKSGVVTNIKVSVRGIRKIKDRITGENIETNFKYCVTANNTELSFCDADDSSTSKYEGELYETTGAATETVKNAEVKTNTKGRAGL